MFSLATLYMVSHCRLISIKVVVHCQYSSSLDWKLTFLCELQFWNFQKNYFSFTSFWGCVEITKNDFWQNSIIYLHRQINLKYLPALSLSLSLSLSLWMTRIHSTYLLLTQTTPIQQDTYILLSETHKVMGRLLVLCTLALFALVNVMTVVRRQFCWSRLMSTCHVGELRLVVIHLEDKASRNHALCVSNIYHLSLVTVTSTIILFHPLYLPTYLAVWPEWVKFCHFGKISKVGCFCEFI